MAATSLDRSTYEVANEMLDVHKQDAQLSDNEKIAERETESYVREQIESANFTDAHSRLDKALKRFDISKSFKSQLFLLKGSAYLKEAKLPEALVWLHAWTDQFPGEPQQPRVHFLLASIYESMGEMERAKEFYYRTLSSSLAKGTNIKDDQKITEVIAVTELSAWKLAEIEYKARNDERANELYERFKKQHPGSEQLIQATLYRQADISLRNKRIDEARSRYETALAIGPFHPFAPEAWLQLMNIHYSKGNEQEFKNAMQSFQWLVNNSHKEKIEHWKKRSASVLAETLKHQPEQQAEFLKQLADGRPLDEWLPKFAFYYKLVNRTAPQTISIKEMEGVDNEWIDYKNKINNTTQRANDKIQQLESRGM